jgi:mobilization protein MobC
MTLGRRKAPEDRSLQYVINTRVNAAKYAELQRLLESDPGSDMSTLVRDILYNRKIKVFTRDTTMTDTMEEMARLRSEIRAIGININQITRFFNTYPEPSRKHLYAKMAFDEYRALEPKINQLLTIASKLAKKWLSE